MKQELKEAKVKIKQQWDAHQNFVADFEHLTKYARKLEKKVDLLNGELDCCRSNHMSMVDKDKALEEENQRLDYELKEKKAVIVKIADFIEATIKEGQAELIGYNSQLPSVREEIESCEGFISALMRIKVAVGIIARNDPEEIVANYKYASADIHNALGI
jgi:chromosome segregation ATPase